MTCGGGRSRTDDGICSSTIPTRPGRNRNHWERLLGRAGSSLFDAEREDNGRSPKVYAWIDQAPHEGEGHLLPGSGAKTRLLVTLKIAKIGLVLRREGKFDDACGC